MSNGEKNISQSEIKSNWRDIFIITFKIKPHQIKFKLIPTRIMKYLNIHNTFIQQLK